MIDNLKHVEVENTMTALIANVRSKFAELGYVPESLSLQLKQCGVNVSALERNLQEGK